MATMRCLSLEELRVITTPQLVSQGSNNSVTAANVSDTDLLDVVMFTALDGTVIDKHLTAACNALCFVALRMSDGADDQVRAHVFSTHTWLGLVDVIRKAFHDGKNKPALQVLDALSTLAQSHPDIALAQSNIERTVIHLLRTVFCRDPATEMKQACIMLSFFLRKLSDFMTFPELLGRTFSACRSNLARRCKTLNHRVILVGEDYNAAWRGFALALILAVGHPDSKSAALKLLTLVYTSTNDQHGSSVQKSVIEAVEICGSGGPEASSNVIRIVLPAILDTPTQLKNFLDQQQQHISKSVEHLLLVLTAIEVAREKGFILEENISKLLSNSLLIVDDDIDPFDSLLSHHDTAVRLKAFKLLIMSNSPNIPFAKRTTDCLLRNFPILFNDTDAYMRSEIISTMKRLCTRLKLSRTSTMKKQLHAKPLPVNSLYIQQCDQFANALLDFLECELSIHQTYSRHILALHSILILYDSFAGIQQDMHLAKLQNFQFINKLIVLVLDAYDDVRGLAMQILHKTSQDTSLPLLADSDLLAVSKLTANTNRADHADAYGRLLLLASTSSVTGLKSGSVLTAPDRSIRTLLKTVTSHLSSCDSFNVNDNFPLHGTLLGIAYCLPHIEQLMELKPNDMQSALCIARKIWSLAQPHLCVDSPEMETEDDDDDLAGPKDLLAYAWRALRDSNVMMQAILRSTVVTKDLCEAIGDLTFEQLSLLRHRGAFSSVAQTFVLCCDKLRGGTIADPQSVLEPWFNQAILQIDAQADRLTRRSAGLPSMFAAILDPKSTVAFSRRFSRLIALASVDTIDDASVGLPEVHALNCLKDIMTNSRFRQVTEAFLLSMIDLAARRISSEVWAVKNCGLMLLRACINRLDNSYVSGDRTQENLLESETNDADPATIALRLLGSQQTNPAPTTNQNPDAAIVGQNINNEAIFASLDLLSRVYIKRKKRSDTMNAIITQLGHSVWHIRAQASRLLAQIALPDEELTLAESLLCPQTKISCYNNVHGAYLGAHALLGKLINVAEEEEFCSRFVHALSRSADLFSDHITMPIAASWLDMANTLLALSSISVHDIEMIVASFKSMLLGLDKNECQPSASFTRSKALYLAYLQILEPSFIMAYSTWSTPGADEDDVKHIITHVAGVTDPVHAARAVQLIAEYIQPRESAPILAAALSAFASLLPRCRDHISELSVDHVSNVIDFKADGNRDWLLAQILAYATLVLYGDSPSFHRIAGTLQTQTSTFVRVLRLAAADQIDLPTRETALEALGHLITVSPPKAIAGMYFQPELQCELHLILYDLLNDDDEDIRAQAATIVHTLLKTHESEVSHPTPECAYSARTQLRRFVVSRSRNQHEFVPNIFVKIFGIRGSFEHQSSTEAVLDYCEKHTVAKDLQEITSKAKDLFAEEKQNLYIDEVADIKAWSDCLGSNHGDFTSDIIWALQKWCVLALGQVAHLIREDLKYRELQTNSDDGKTSWTKEYMILSEQTLFSVTNNPEVLIMVLRVIVTAKLLVKWDIDLPDVLHTSSGTIVAGLEDLKNLCFQASVHREIETALKE